MCLKMSIFLILIFILILLIKTFDKILFKNFLLISDMMHFEFIYMMTLVSRKAKNIIKITKCHFLKTSLIFDVFFDINLMIKHSKFMEYVIFSIFFCSLLIISLLLIKIIIIFVAEMINAVFVLKTILLMFFFFFISFEINMQFVF